MAIFEFHRHEHIEHRQLMGPPTTAGAADVVHGQSKVGQFNARLAVKITNSVGSMWTAYLFCLLALLSLPAVLSGFSAFAHSFPKVIIKASVIALVAWVAQTFIQLVLLPIIIVGQNVQAAASDARAEATYKDADAVLHTALQIEEHLQAQDVYLKSLLLQQPPTPPAVPA